MPDVKSAAATVAKTVAGDSPSPAATPPAPAVASSNGTPQKPPPIPAATFDMPKPNLRGLNKPKCIQCGNVARSRYGDRVYQYFLIRQSYFFLLMA
jgi:hypothetical protein